MAYVDSTLTALSAAEPVFRRIDGGVRSRSNQSHADTESIPFSREQQHYSVLNRDIEPPRNDQLAAQVVEGEKSRFVLAVDFGTTYSTVAYAKVDHGTDAAGLTVQDVRCIDNYKNAIGGSDARSNSRIDNVPTELLYLGMPILARDTDSSGSASEASRPGNMVVGGNEIRTNIRSAGRKRAKKRSAKVMMDTTHGTWTRRAGVSLKWGFGVQDKQKFPQELQRYEESETVKLIKLTLGDEVDHLTDKRRELAEQIQRLQSRHFVQDRDHVLRDYLTRLLHHAKGVLRHEAGFQDDSDIEFVLCVPVSWSERACRIMHDAMVRAIQKCNLGGLAQDIIRDLFIVSEPEAAAQFVLAALGHTGRLRKDEVFVLLDAGGGTVDITTYKVTSDDMGPLRLKGEMVPPDGALCGSSLIGERYAAALKTKLLAENPTYGTNIEGEDLLDKPKVDIDKNVFGTRRNYLNGHRIVFTKQEICALFEPSLKGVTDLLEKQLDLVAKGGLTVSKLIVVGGFGESPSLRERIERLLARKCNLIGAPIVTIWPQAFPTSAVGRGAVLRTLNKQNGPSRISRSSFGFLQHEQYKFHAEHEEAGVVPTRDSVDHYPNVLNTIYWVIQAGTELPTTFEAKPVESCHHFSPSDKKLVCGEKLYSSPRKHRSHFQNHHPENEGAFLLSEIEVDVSEFRDEFPLKAKANTGPRTKVSNRKYREVKFDLVIMVEGRQLKYEARWPSRTTSTNEVRKRKRGYISLAPSFVPGTE